MQTLRSLMDKFKEDSAIHTEISVVRTLSMTESIAGAVDELSECVYFSCVVYF